MSIDTWSPPTSGNHSRKRVLREEGRFVYWKDDSHWNGRGIRVAAKAVCRALGAPAAPFGG